MKRLENDELKLNYLKFRLQMLFRYFKLFLSSIMITVFMIVMDYCVFKLFTENSTVINVVIAINATIILLLMGVSISNILQLLEKIRFFKDGKALLSMEENENGEE